MSSRAKNITITGSAFSAETVVLRSRQEGSRDCTGGSVLLLGNIYSPMQPTDNEGVTRTI